ncbi:hypothetical protein JCM5296_001940 [Sporobolomyces johnsonii]
MLVARSICRKPFHLTTAVRFCRSFSFRPTPPTPSLVDWLRTPAWVKSVTDKIPYRIVRKSDVELGIDDDFNRLPALEQIRRAMHGPVPIELPRLRNDRLAALLFGGKELGTLSEREERDFREAYHRERLEFVGDRIWEEVAVLVVFSLAPIQRLSTKAAVPSLGPLQNETSRLTTNEMAAKLAREFKLDKRLGTTAIAHLADGWEAYLTALLFSNGRRAVLEFLAPVIKREFFEMHRPYDALPPLVFDQLSAPTSRPLLTEPLRFRTLAAAIAGFTTEIDRQKFPKCLETTDGYFALTLPGYPQIRTPTLPRKTRARRALALCIAQGSVVIDPKLAPPASAKSRALTAMEKMEPLRFPTLAQATDKLFSVLVQRKIPHYPETTGGQFTLTLPGFPLVCIPRKPKSQLRRRLVEQCIAQGSVVIELRDAPSSEVPSDTSPSTARSSSPPDSSAPPANGSGPSSSSSSSPPATTSSSSPALSADAPWTSAPWPSAPWPSAPWPAAPWPGAPETRRPSSDPPSADEPPHFLSFSDKVGEHVEETSVPDGDSALPSAASSATEVVPSPPASPPHVFTTEFPSSSDALVSPSTPPVEPIDPSSTLPASDDLELDMIRDEAVAVELDVDPLKETFADEMSPKTAMDEPERAMDDREVCVAQGSVTIDPKIAPTASAQSREISAMKKMEPLPFPTLHQATERFFPILDQRKLPYHREDGEGQVILTLAGFPPVRAPRFPKSRRTRRLVEQCIAQGSVVIEPSAWSPTPSPSGPAAKSPLASAVAQAWSDPAPAATATKNSLDQAESTSLEDEMNKLLREWGLLSEAVSSPDAASSEVPSDTSPSTAPSTSLPDSSASPAPGSEPPSSPASSSLATTSSSSGTPSANAPSPGAPETLLPSNDPPPAPSPADGPPHSLSLSDQLGEPIEESSAPDAGSALPCAVSPVTQDVPSPPADAPLLIATPTSAPSIEAPVSPSPSPVEEPFDLSTSLPAGDDELELDTVRDEAIAVELDTVRDEAVAVELDVAVDSLEQMMTVDERSTRTAAAMNELEQAIDGREKVVPGDEVSGVAAVAVEGAEQSSDGEVAVEPLEEEEVIKETEDDNSQKQGGPNDGGGIGDNDEKKE